MPRADSPPRLTLPAQAEDPPKTPFPVAMIVVPVIGALAMWAITGSVFALWFAALGPLLAVASVVDSARGRRRHRRRERRARAGELRRLDDDLERLHTAERARARERHPDVVAFSRRPEQIWRAVAGRSGAIVVGQGEVESGVQLDGAVTPDSEAVAARVPVLGDAPVLAPLRGTIAVVGPRVLAAAVVRGLALQVACAIPPQAIRIDGPAEAEWIRRLPHAAAGAPRVLAIGDHADASSDDDVRIVVSETRPPPGAGVVITLDDARTATVDIDGVQHAFATAPFSRSQATRLADALTERFGGAGSDGTDVPLDFDALGDDLPPAAPGSLPAAIGTHGGGTFVLDLVRDGPHAVAIGVTGSGKSELLVTWITSLCARHSPEEVAFLLVDFKGGSSFDGLRSLPHVSGVVTDLDDGAARRALESVRAELRRRERRLAELRARDIDGAGGALGRLVIVVDEFAALSTTHPDLHDLFADVAARGRSLGVHLILASQRSHGVFRDAVLANCPLRVSLRVTDELDSRAVLGTPDAANLPGDARGRGLALIRRGQDSRPTRVRIARTPPTTIDRLVRERPAPRARAVWLPALPSRVEVSDVTDAAGIGLGLTDLPEEQAQRVARWQSSTIVVVGRVGAGKSSVLRALSAQSAQVQPVSVDALEAAWDAIEGFDELASGALVVVDDLDRLIASFPPDYAPVVAEAIERLVREASSRGVRVALALSRMGGPAGRIADLVPDRVVLAQTGRAELIGAGAPTTFGHNLPVGRGIWGEHLTQFATVDEAATPPPVRTPPTAAGVTGRGAEAGAPRVWTPDGVAGLVVPDGRGTRATLAAYRERGWRTASVAEVAAHTATTSATTTISAADRLLVWGPAEQWIGHQRVLAGILASGQLAFDTRTAADLRLLTGSRRLPPFATLGARRVWVWDDGAVSRCVLPPPVPEPASAVPQ